MNDKYRTDQYGSVYEYDDEHNGYVFIAKLNGRTLDQVILDLIDDEGIYWP